MRIIEFKKVADDVIISHLKIKTYTKYLTNPLLVVEILVPCEAHLSREAAPLLIYF